MHQTGGFAGFDWRFRLLGKYDLVHGDAAGTRAKFANAEIWGSRISDGPVTADVLDVDRVFNLAGLKGESVPVAAPFDVYRFTGETADGSSVNLFASVFGPWMYVRGGTQPPPGSADFFQYDIRMLARSRPFADFNDDGRVDGADYVLARKASATGIALAADGIFGGASIDRLATAVRRNGARPGRDGPATEPGRGLGEFRWRGSRTDDAGTRSGGRVVGFPPSAMRAAQIIAGWRFQGSLRDARFAPGHPTRFFNAIIGLPVRAARAMGLKNKVLRMHGGTRAGDYCRSTRTGCGSR